MWIKPAVAIGQSRWSIVVYDAYLVIRRSWVRFLPEPPPPPLPRNIFFTAAPTCTEHSVIIYVGIRQNYLKSTGRDRSWTGDYAVCGRCHLAPTAWFAHVPYLLQSDDGSIPRELYNSLIKIYYHFVYFLKYRVYLIVLFALIFSFCIFIEGSTHYKHCFLVGCSIFRRTWFDPIE